MFKPVDDPAALFPELSAFMLKKCINYYQLNTFPYSAIILIVHFFMLSTLAPDLLASLISELVLAVPLGLVLENFTSV